MDKRTELQLIRQYITTNEYVKALKQIQELLSRGMVDYNLFVFAGAVYSELGNAVEALEFYRKAIELDEGKVTAWKGIFKSYHTGKFPLDDFALSAIEKTIELSGADPPDKKKEMQEIRMEILLRLKKFEMILKEDKLLEDVTFCRSVLNSLVAPYRSYSSVEEALCLRCVAKLELISMKAPPLHLKITQFKVALCDNFDDLCLVLSKHANVCCPSLDDWTVNEMRNIVSASTLTTRSPDQQFNTFLELTEQSEFEILLHLMKGLNPASALSFVDSLPDEKLNWPLTGLVIPTLMTHERFENVLTAAEKALPAMHPVVLAKAQKAMASARVEALYGIGDEESLSLLDSLLKSPVDSSIWNFIMLSRLSESKEVSQDDFYATLGSCDVGEGNYHFFRALYAKNHGHSEEAIVAARKAVLLDPKWWKYQLLLAEAYLAHAPSAKYAYPVLQRASALNRYSSRVFLLLGQYVFEKNKAAGLACLERAAKICPSDPVIAEVYSKFLAAVGKRREQLNLIRTFLLSSPKSLWARRQLGLVEASLINAWEGNKLKGEQFEEAKRALEHLQQYARINSEDRAIWSAIGDLFEKIGNFQSAKKAFKMVIELDPSNVYARLKLIDICNKTGFYEDAVEQCEEMRSVAKGKTPKYLAVMHADSILRLAKISDSTGQLRLLCQFFEIIGDALEQNSDSATAYKISGDAAVLASRFHMRTFKSIKFPQKWGVSSPEDAMRVAIEHYTKVITFRDSWASSWNDLGIAIVQRCRLSKNDLHAPKAVDCFKRAISLSTVNVPMSVYWSNLSQAVDLVGEKITVQHCLIRAVQQSRSNAIAWCLLGLLGLQVGQMNFARKSFTTAQQCDPDLAEAWCALALIADSEGHYDTVDLFRHSLSLKPTELAVAKYSYAIAEELRKSLRCDNATMFDFKSVNDLYGVSSRSDHFTFFVALLAEHFRCFAPALHYIQCCVQFPDKEVLRLHEQRLLIRNDQLERACCEPLKKFKSLFALPLNELFDKLLKDNRLYKDLFDAVIHGDPMELKKLLSGPEYPVMAPLLIAASLAFKMEVSNELLNVLDGIRPHHLLIDVFPPSKIRSVSEEHAYKIDEIGEQPVVRHDSLSQPLHGLLSSKREMLYATRKNEVDSEEAAEVECDRVERGESPSSG